MGREVQLQMYQGLLDYQVKLNGRVPRVRQFFQAFTFPSLPEMALNSCHRNPEVLVPVDQGPSAVGACGLGAPRTSFI